ncbi:beta-glucosidase BglX [Ferrimonas marina]|uniref:beta-glucosidase n=1 Tax=Ferrimonas marina TaxID=299255 RepID=A0A1M5YCD0_9GAMM|nr:beta-glucosidase BglX [Ferrimonas marina]SHI09498.1 beta-glucosidase [Ferrimonas marina]
MADEVVALSDDARTFLYLDPAHRMPTTNRRPLWPLMFALALPVAQASDAAHYLDPQPRSVPTILNGSDQAAMNVFIDQLLGQMTQAEKLGQLGIQAVSNAGSGPYLEEVYERQLRAGHLGAVFNVHGAQWSRQLQEIAVKETRLGIPLLMGHDILHGYKTIFPQPIGEAASWDLELAEANARAAAREATADGIMWTFAPMADVTRDPRWGRVSEGAGEDVYLTTRMSVARVKGFQGESLSAPDTMMATAKHFVGYGMVEAGRDYNRVQVSEVELKTHLLPPFKAMVDAGVGSVMTAFNEVNGIPVTASQQLVRQLLRQQWGFEGLVISDYQAISDLIPHGVAADPGHAAQLAFDAGVDMEMMSQNYFEQLPARLASGQISQAALDQSVRRVLESKWRLGLFEDPYRYADPVRAEREVLSEALLKQAREAAQRSFVLLKNQGQTLPLDPKRTPNIALIGPLADSKRDMIGNWAAVGDRRTQPVTLKEGLEARFGSEVTLRYAKGASYQYSTPADQRAGFRAALDAAEESDIILLAMGEHERQTGEASSRVGLGLPGNQLALMKELKALGKPMVLVVFSGRPNDLSWADEHVDAILHAWYPGTMAGHALADVLSGDVSPSGKLPISFPRSVGQIPIYYSSKNTGRPYNANNPNQRAEHYTSRYDDSRNTPLYAFGHGLSYSRFEYGALSLSSDSLSEQTPLTVELTVTNRGDYAGEEVVQLYTRQKVGSRTRPVQELKGWRKLHFEPGQTRTVRFELSPDDLAFYRADNRWGWEPGEFEVMVGSASNRVQRATFQLLPSQP